MALKAGTVRDFADSMAEAMEEAFGIEWRNVKGYDVTDVGQEDRRVLLAAIAQGVVKHLVEKAGEAFQISVGVTQNEPLVVSQNPEQINITPSLGGGYIDIGDANVTQAQGTENMVKSSGTAHIEQVKVEGTLY